MSKNRGSATERGCCRSRALRGQAGDRHRGPPTTWGFWPRVRVHLAPRQVTRPGFGRILPGSAGFGPAGSGLSKFYWA